MVSLPEAYISEEEETGGAGAASASAKSSLPTEINSGRF